MNRIVMACVLLLLPFSGHAAPVMGDSVPGSLPGQLNEPARDESKDPGNRRIAFSEPALWFPDTRGRRDMGVLPGNLPVDKGRLSLSNEGLHYAERIGFGDRASELLTIPYTEIASVRTEQSAGTYMLLIVNRIDRSKTVSQSHAFLILQPGFESQVAATQALALIESQLSRVLISMAAVSADASQVSKTQTVTPVPGVVLEEKIAISTAQWQPAVEFYDPKSVPPASPNRFKDSVSAGAAIGAMPLAACAHVPGCTPAALVPGLALMASGAIVGAIIGVGRELTAAFQKMPPPPPSFSPQDVQAATPLINAALGAALGQPALHECVQRKLSSSAVGVGPVQWTDGTRTASLSPVGGVGPLSPGEAAPYPDLSRSGFRYLIESSLSRVLLVPEGIPGQRAEDVPVAIVLEGSLQFVDLENGQSQPRLVSWRAEPRTLRGWSAADGVALNDTLKNACEELAGQFVTEAERIWRNR